MSFDHLFVDPGLEKDGIWWEDTRSDLKMRIANYESEAAREFYTRMVTDKAMLIQAGGPEAAAYLTECETQRLAFCVKEWKGMPNPADPSKTIKYSFSASLKLLSDPRARPIRKIVSYWARNDDAFRPEKAASDAAGN